MAGRRLLLDAGHQQTEPFSRGLVPWNNVDDLALVHHDDAVRERLGELHAAGGRLTYHDFASGTSSIGHLRRLDFDIIKIDRSLVTGIEHEEDVAMIARAVISLGQSLRKTVVAEGVENQAQFDFLRYQGCDEFQVIGPPMPPPDFVALLAKTGGQL